MSGIREAVVSIVREVRQRLSEDRNAHESDIAVSILRELEEAGFADVMASESQGGSGGSFSDLVEVIQGVADEGVSLPLARRNIASQVIAESEASSAASLPALYMRHGDFESASAAVDGTMVLKDVPMMTEAKTGLVPSPHERTHLVVDVAAGDSETRVDYNLMRTATVRAPVRDQVKLEGDRKDLQHYSDSYTVLLLAEATALISAVYLLTLSYTRSRQQFGKAISEFPPVQSLLVDLAQAVAVSNSVFNRAEDALMNNGDSSSLAPACWAAKTAIGQAVRASHQCHGAIGMTEEYALSRYSRRLHQLMNELSADWGSRSSRYLEKVSQDGYMASLLDSRV